MKICINLIACESLKKNKIIACMWLMMCSIVFFLLFQFFIEANSFENFRSTPFDAPKESSQAACHYCSYPVIIQHKNYFLVHFKLKIDTQTKFHPRARDTSNNILPSIYVHKMCVLIYLINECPREWRNIITLFYKYTQ